VCSSEEIFTHEVINNFTVWEIRWDFLKFKLKVADAEPWIGPKGINIRALNGRGGYLGWLRGMRAMGRRREGT
jgi:hypothetical protein